MTEANIAPEGSEKELVLTSADEIKRLSDGVIVELPEFMDGTPFVARLRRPAILRMVELGKIPNELCSVVDRLMGNDKAEEASLEERAKVLNIVAEASLVEPSFDQVKDMLATYQLNAIWNCAMYGVESVAPFRRIARLLNERKDGTEVQPEAEPTPTD